MKVLELKDVDKTFYTETGEVKVLDDLSMEIEKGQIVAIVGPSGAGKSTILNIIAGLIEPTIGEVKVDGDIGYMFQKDHLFSWRTAWHNILIGLEITKQNDTIHQERVKTMLKKYDLFDFINNYPHELSGGMRQRIALIRTLATNPSILLLDEPFSALDYQTRLVVSEDVYKIIKNENLTAILVTHDISEAIAMADEIIVLTKRPAKVKNIHYVKLNINESSPIARRKADNFGKYFDLIWRELNE